MIKKLFFKASFRSIIAAALNFFITIMIIRLLGSESYNNYIIDLAVISLISIIYELIPSNFSLFKVQDDLTWKDVVASQIIISAFIGIALTYLIGNYFSAFNIFTMWFILYIVVLGVKKYQDITLQSTGRVDEFFKLESYIAALRLLLVITLYNIGFSSVNVIWASLVISMIIVQVVWFIGNKDEIKSFLSISKKNTHQRMLINKLHYYPYYIGIVLKKLKDNSIPIVANYFFKSPEILAAFFLTYRGIAFSISQVRIIESMMINRSYIDKINKITFKYKLVISAVIQTISLSVAIVLQLFSGLESIDFELNLLLSLIVYPIIFSMFGRANALSKFDPKTVNTANFSYLIVLMLSVGAALLLHNDGVVLFIFILILSELAILSAFLLRKSIND